MYKTKCTTSLIGLSRTLESLSVYCPLNKIVFKCVHVFTPRLFRTARLTAAAVLPRGRRAWWGSPVSPCKFSFVVTKMIFKSVLNASRTGRSIMENPVT